MRLKNKTALITGGNSGIGLETARVFVAEGAKVIITGRNKETLAQAEIAQLVEHLPSQGGKKIGFYLLQFADGRPLYPYLNKQVLDSIIGQFVIFQELEGIIIETGK